MKTEVDGWVSEGGREKRESVPGAGDKASSGKRKRGVALVTSYEGPNAADLGHKGFKWRVLCCMHVTIK